MRLEGYKILKRDLFKIADVIRKIFLTDISVLQQMQRFDGRPQDVTTYMQVFDYQAWKHRKSTSTTPLTA